MQRTASWTFRSSIAAGRSWLPPAAPPPCLPAGQADFLLSDLLTAQGQSLSVQLRDEQGRPLPGCVALLSGEELPQTNAVVGGGRGAGGARSCPSACM